MSNLCTIINKCQNNFRVILVPELNNCVLSLGLCCLMYRASRIDKSISVLADCTGLKPSSGHSAHQSQRAMWSQMAVSLLMLLYPIL